MSFLDSLYKDVILEHYKRPHNRGALDQPSHVQEGENPSCGDELTLYLRVADGIIREIGFEGEGCAISQASASLMTDALKGRSVEAALELSEAFRAMIRGQPPAPELGELSALQGVARLHARVKCATLAWTTLERALEVPGGNETHD
jgi:nitrogen fixation NifU-like protein